VSARWLDEGGPRAVHLSGADYAYELQDTVAEQMARIMHAMRGSSQTFLQKFPQKRVRKKDVPTEIPTEISTEKDILAETDTEKNIPTETPTEEMDHW
jgi:hypothetical protein